MRSATILWNLWLGLRPGMPHLYIHLLLIILFKLSLEPSLLLTLLLLLLLLLWRLSSLIHTLLSAAVHRGGTPTITARVLTLLVAARCLDFLVNHTVSSVIALGEVLVASSLVIRLLLLLLLG
jgi:hypothetical protein